MVADNLCFSAVGPVSNKTVLGRKVSVDSAKEPNHTEAEHVDPRPFEVDLTPLGDLQRQQSIHTNNHLSCQLIRIIIQNESHKPIRQPSDWNLVRF